MDKTNSAGSSGGARTESADVVSQDVLVRSNPDRGRIIDAIKASSAGEMSSKELAAVLGEPTVSGVSYHAKKLEVGGVLEVTRLERVRGAVATYYKVSDQYLARTPDGVTLDILAAHIREGDGSIDAARVQTLVQATGRRVSEDEVLAPPSTGVEEPERPMRIQRIPLNRRCQCPNTVAGEDGSCVSCSKPKAAVREVAA